MNDCVATAPTPASAHGTSPPTANQCDCTATPISPVVGSKATMEKVWTGRRGFSCAGESTARTNKLSDMKADTISLPRNIASPCIRKIVWAFYSTSVVKFGLLLVFFKDEQL